MTSTVVPRASVSQRQAWARRTGDAAAILAGLPLLAACGLIARDGEVGPLEVRVFHAVNGLPEVLTPVMRGAQCLGVLAVGPAVALGAFALRRYRLAGGALLVTGVKLAAERVVWLLVVRSRPGTSPRSGER